MTRIETRAEWGARPPKGTTSLGSTHGVKGHYTGGVVNTGTLIDHEKCQAAVRGIQNGHMDGNGWNDIGYSMVVCDHDVAMIGRGPHVLPAANGPGLNSGHYAILVLVGTGGVTEITDNMKRAFHGARTYLRTHGNAGTEIKGHRDGYATDCPGPSVYPWIKAGAPLPSGGGGVTPPPDPEPGDQDMPEYYSYGRSATNPVEVPTGTDWTRITWDTEYADPGNEHSGAGYTMLKGDPSVYNLTATVEFSDLPAGTVVEARIVEALYQAGPPAQDVVQEAGPIQDHVLGAARTIAVAQNGSVSENRKLILEVRHNAATAGHVSAARAMLLAWQ